ncbi:MAG: protein translocase subunit SecD [Methylocystaceae bacterium]
MRGQSIAKLTAVVIGIALLAGLAFTPIKNHINLGLDLQGGLHVVMEAKEKPGQTISDDTIKKTVAVMRNRIDAMGVKEPIIQTQGNKRVIIELAGVKDPEEAARILGQTAQLKFVDESGKVVVTGNNLKDATANIGQDNQPVVDIEFDKTGSEKFAQATAANVGKTLSIVLDDKVISAPRVDEAITGGKAMIHGGFQNLEEASNLAIQLRSGALPVDLVQAEKRTVGPTLGSDSLKKSIHAGIIGLIMIFIFMLGFYRLPGAVADVSLVFYSVLVLGITALIGQTLTLPGIAGFLLSIGMAVDANIIIYERIKDELRHGKTLQAAIDAGFKRAFVAIVDSNVTTLIAAVVLLYFGTGSIKGFAVTLSIGILASMFTAITFTHWLLRWCADVWKKTSLYGVKEG